MHIPDGYLGPQTYLPAYAVMVPLWAWASRQVRRTLRIRQVPLLALGAAFSFVIMMFNVPVPFGTTGHAAGGVLIAVLLGPWAAVIAVSLALIVQALIFGDGGITALGANCLNMAVVMPMIGYTVYRIIASRAPAHSPRRWLAAAVGGYVGLNAAAFTTAIMFGIQPSIARDAAGRALYAPYGLEVALPAMMLGHLLLFGVVEAAVTGLVVAHIQRTTPELLAPEATPGPGERPRALLPRLVFALVVLALLTPLGLYLPEKLRAGDAWGEWSADDLGRMISYVPQGLQRVVKHVESAWRAPLPDYALPAQESAPLAARSITYVASALLGLALLGLAVLGLRSLLARKEPDEPSADVDASSPHPG